MTTQTKSGVNIRLFMGLELNSEIKLSLSTSDAYKEMKFQPEKYNLKLDEVSSKGKAYLGAYLGPQNATIQELEEIQMELFKMLQEFCPDISDKKLQITLFPQVFLQ